MNVYRVWLINHQKANPMMEGYVFFTDNDEMSKDEKL